MGDTDVLASGDGPATSGGRGEPATSAPSRHWTAVGPRDATTLVFIHGTRLTRAQWLPQLRRLSGQYRCVAIDLPGHGTRAGEAFTIEAAVDSVRVAVEAEAESGRALLVGLSLGGFVAMEAAEAIPDRVLGLVLAGCSAEPVGPSSVPFRAFAALMERAPARLQRVVNLAFFRARYRRAISEPIIAGGFWSEGGAQALRTLVGRRYLERLGRLWTPVTIVNGALDPVFGPGTEPWAFTARRGRRVIIPWALHLSNLDRPRTFSAIVAAAAEDAIEYPASAG
ncbi:MAG TPA: alpha/beta hydrolase [Candidatus Limnocylindrales bacterium]|nr:alpha/beta hydrolase [Candidatus Limnocylindrales bacterium]